MRTKILAATAALPSRTKAGLVALGTVTVLLASACAASHGVKTQSDAAKTVGSTASKSSSAATVGWGSRIVLNGPAHGEKMAVTLTKVIPFARPPLSSWGPPPVGDRFYAVQFRLTNIGSDVYSNWPNARVVDSEGRSYDLSGSDVPSCHSFMSSAQTIQPGTSALGCLVREIPKHAAITRVRFTFPSGDTGQWNVG